MVTYSDEFFLAHQPGAKRSARAVVPLVLNLVKARSVVDVGCGLGTWLAVFQEHGITEFRGVDGPYVDQTRLEIPQDRFLVHDLTQPLPNLGSFDLAMSLEVGEHLPKPSAANLIDSLVNHAPLVLFSAAIPYQGGTHHVNEQWPQYWAALFFQRGYCVIDCLRREIWNNNHVEWWYAQNLLLYARTDHVLNNARLLKELAHTNRSQLALIHPARFLGLVDENVALMKRLNAMQQPAKREG